MNAKVNSVAVLFAVSVCFAVFDAAAVLRTKREAYDLPDGIEFYLGSLVQEFNCAGLADGYYADYANDCRLFHICHTHDMPDGTTKQAQYSFACGNQTMFNSFSMTCDHPEASIPCQENKNFEYLNQKVGTDQNLHEDADVEKAALYAPNRVAKK